MGEGQRGWRGLSASRPHQHATILIPSGLLRVEKFILEGFQGIVVQVELYFEGPIGYTPPLTQERDHLIHDCDKVHPLSSLPGAQPVCSYATPSIIA